MIETLKQRVARVTRLLEAARRLADPDDSIGQRARAELPRSTGLSRQGVELGLTTHLETNATDQEIEALCRSVPAAPRAHVLLASNVFVAPVRAIALALAQSARVDVRASRREPVTAALLAEASHGAFRIVEELVPSGGDHVWAYGSDETLRTLRGELPAGVVLHAHGAGFGVAVVEGLVLSDVAKVAQCVARDVVPFDQRGCLSPRVVLVSAPEDVTRAFAEALARALGALHHDVPRGDPSPEEAAELTRYRDTMSYAAEVFHAGLGVVGVDTAGTLLLPPVGRNVHVARTEDPAEAIVRLGSEVTAIGIHGSRQLAARLAEVAAGARQSALGAMQRPPLDGPVDRRKRTEPRVL